MNTPTQINTGFQLCDGSDGEGRREGKAEEEASISPILSHAEAPELQNISRIAVAIKTLFVLKQNFYRIVVHIWKGEWLKPGAGVGVPNQECICMNSSN